MGIYTTAYGNSKPSGFDLNAWNSVANLDAHMANSRPEQNGSNPYAALGHQVTAPQQTLQQRIFAEHQKAQDAYNQEAEGRYSQATGLYGNLLNNPSSYAYQPSQRADALSGMVNGGMAGAQPQGINLNKWGAGNLQSDSPLWGPQAAAMTSDFTRRGLGDSTFGVNSAIVGNSTDLANIRNRELQNQFEFANLGMRQDQTNYGMQQDAVNRRDKLTGGLVDLIASKTATPPPSREDIAYEYGQGSTDNMVAPAVAGGGGGMPVYGSGSYGLGSYYGAGSGYGGYGQQAYAPPKQATGGRTISPAVAAQMRYKQAQYDARGKGGLKATNVQSQYGLT